MSRPPTDLGRLLREFREVLCLCPRCGEIHRLADLRLYTRGVPKRTALDLLDDEEGRLAKVEERLDRLEETFRDAARAAGAKSAKKRLRRIDPVFSGRGLDPQDVKLIFDPVEYVVFRGDAADDIREILLFAEPPSNLAAERAKESVAVAIRKGNVEFATLRVTEAGGIERKA